MAQLTHIRSSASKCAIVFVHGFTGDASKTWANFPTYLAADNSLAKWNILSLGYPTSFLPGSRGVWAADPSLPILASGFYTELDISPLNDYNDIAIVAHSMGGLVVQRSLVDHPELTKRVRHLFLFGTPSGGIAKANLLDHLLGVFANDQIQNMSTRSDFILSLREGWRQTFGDTPPFQFLTIAGDKDNFVLPKSSLEPFPRAFRRVVDGDHLKIVKPANASADVVRLLTTALNRSALSPNQKELLGLAAELGAQAPEGMKIAHAAASDNTPRNLTESEVVDAALALDRAGLQPDAIRLLERYQHFTDAKGTLAGRIKRRWIQENHDSDAHWALGLYSDALETSLATKPETNVTISQIFYRAINVAYLKLVAFDDSAAAREMARLALTYAMKIDSNDVWAVATEAEAWLYLGEEQQALAKYKQVVSMSPEKWKLLSTAQQAQQVAAKLGNASLQQQLRDLFEPPADRLSATV